MNDFTYTLAILVRKDILSVDEAHSLQIAHNEGVTNANLGEMIAKVDKALKKNPNAIKKINAKDILNQT